MRGIIPVAGLGLGLSLAMATAPVPALAGGACRGEPVTDGHGVTVHIKGLCFTPTVLHAKVGDEVTWVNDGPDIHTVSGANISFGDYSEIAPGKQVTYRFTTAGAYPYYCFLHAGMVGTLVVGDGAGPGAATGSIAESFSRRPSVVTPAPVAIVAKSSSAVPNPILILIAAVTTAGAAVGGFVLGRRRAS